MKLRKIRCHVVLLSIAFFFPLSLAHASFVFVDNFNAENATNNHMRAFGYTGFQHWNVVLGDVDLVGNGGGSPYPSNRLYVDLDGFSTNSGGRIETKQTFGSGTYELTFDLAGGTLGGPNDIVTVSFGLSYRETFGPLVGLSGFNTVVRTVTIAPGDMTGRLVFDHAAHALEGDGSGPNLDNITIFSIPEPSSLTLVIIAMSFISAWRKSSS